MVRGIANVSLRYAANAGGGFSFGPTRSIGGEVVDGSHIIVTVDAMSPRYGCLLKRLEEPAVDGPFLKGAPARLLVNTHTYPTEVRDHHS